MALEFLTGKDKMIYPHDFDYFKNSSKLLQKNHKTQISFAKSNDKFFRTMQSLGLAAESDVEKMIKTKKPEKNLSFWRKISNECRRYCSESSIHGFRYLVDENLNYFER